MGIVNVTINHKPYTLACDDGQEEALKSIAARFDDRVRQVFSQLGPKAAEPLALVLAALMVEDELGDMKNAHASIAEELAGRAPSLERAKLQDMEITLAKTLNDIATRVEKITEDLEKAG